MRGRRQVVGGYARANRDLAGLSCAIPYALDRICTGQHSVLSVGVDYEGCEDEELTDGT
jgi:hypothetical protein